MQFLQTGIFVFDQVEVLDFAGPFEVLSRTRMTPGVESRRTEETAPFRVFTVAKSKEPIRATGGLQIVPDFGWDDSPPLDLLVVPGGFGTRPLLEDEATIRWIAGESARGCRIASVCTGALLLAKAGLLEGKCATTHWCALDLLEGMEGATRVQRGRRFVDDGGVVTSAGVAAGIDMAFYLVGKLCGFEVARETAEYIEYPYSSDCE